MSIFCEEHIFPDEKVYAPTCAPKSLTKTERPFRTRKGFTIVRVLVKNYDVKFLIQVQV